MRANLTDRAIIAVTGADAREFLQGLVTNDILRLAPHAALYAALLTPQGKILFDFLIYDRDSAILLDCARAVVEMLQKRLSMYRLRAKVEIARRDDLSVIALWDGDDTPTDWRDPRVSDLGCRAIAQGQGPQGGAAEAYTAHRLALGVPEAHDFGRDEMFALDADLEELHGVSFEKGCYVGQELTARMKHRGTARKKLLPIQTTADVLPEPGTRVSADGTDLGAITSTYENRGFALIRMDRLSEAKVTAVNADGAPVRVIRPVWLFA